MPVGFARGDYFAEQALESRYTYCLVCNKHFDAPPVFHYALGDDRIFLHAECVVRLIFSFVEDLTQAKWHGMVEPHLWEQLEGIARAIGPFDPPKPLPTPIIVEAAPAQDMSDPDEPGMKRG
jgi:hypothetical protein